MDLPILKTRFRASNRGKWIALSIKRLKPARMGNGFEDAQEDKWRH
jgi:hypothetical protein